MQSCKTCETCKHWETGRKTVNTCKLGVCEGKFGSSSDSFIDTSFIPRGTSLTFGCTLHDNKEPQYETK